MRIYQCKLISCNNCGETLAFSYMPTKTCPGIIFKTKYMLNKGNVCSFNSSVQKFLFMIHSMKFKPQQQSMSSCVLLSQSDTEKGSKRCQFTRCISLDTCCLRPLLRAFSLLWVTFYQKEVSLVMEDIGHGYTKDPA